MPIFYKIKSTELVPVRALVAFDNHLAGDVFGLTPETAVKMWPANPPKIEAIVPPEGLEVEEIHVGPVEPEVEVPAEPQVDVEVPEGWESAKHFTKLSLAAKILGRKPEKGEDLDAVISAYVSARTPA